MNAREALEKLVAASSRYAGHDADLDEAVDAAVKSLSEPDVVYLVHDMDERALNEDGSPTEKLLGVFTTPEEARACWEEGRQHLLDQGIPWSTLFYWVRVNRVTTGRGGAVEQVLGLTHVSGFTASLYVGDPDGRETGGRRIGQLLLSESQKEGIVSEYPERVEFVASWDTYDLAAPTLERLLELAREKLQEHCPGAELNVVEQQEG